MLHDDVRVDRLKVIPAAACQRRSRSRSFLDPMLHPVLAILVPAEHIKDRNDLQESTMSANTTGSFTARVPSLSR